MYHCLVIALFDTKNCSAGEGQDWYEKDLEQDFRLSVVGAGFNEDRQGLRRDKVEYVEEENEGENYA